MDICVIVNNVQINEARTIFSDGTLWFGLLIDLIAHDISCPY